MIVRTAFLFLLFGFSFSINAQKSAPATLDWGNEYNEPANTFATKLIGLRPNGFYVLREKILNNPEAKPRVWVEFYDRDMNMKKRVEQELKYKGKKRDFEDVIFLGDQLYLLTSFNNAAKKKNFLFRQKISMKSLIPSKKLDMICETEARNREAEGTFDFHISKDSSHLLLYNELPYEKNEPERFGFRVFDQNFDLIWEKDIVLPFPDNQFTVEDYQVDNKGNVHLLGVLYKDGSKWRRRGNPTYQYIILSYAENGEKEEEFRIDLTDKFITDLTFRVAKKGELVCSGFYSDRGTYGIKGAFYMRLDPITREVRNRNFQAFEFDFLTEFMSERNKKKAKEAERKKNSKRRAELYDYSLDELILRSDGGAVLVAEQYYVQQEYYDNNPYGFSPYGYGYGYGSIYNRNRYNNRPDYYYNYNDIIVVNIRPTGEIEWAARIPKRQETRNDGGYYLSYAMSIVRDKIYFLYNDNARNHRSDRKPGRFFNYNGSDSIMALAQINKNGEVTTYPLASNREAGVITRPKMCKQIGKKEMAVFGEQGRGYRFAKLTFE